MRQHDVSGKYINRNGNKKPRLTGYERGTLVVLRGAGLSVCAMNDLPHGASIRCVEVDRQSPLRCCDFFFVTVYAHLWSILADGQPFSPLLRHIRRKTPHSKA